MPYPKGWGRALGRRTTLAGLLATRMDPETRRQLVEEHLDAIRKLEREPSGETAAASWPPQGFYLLWHVVVGMVLGTVGAVVSLLANVAGAPLSGERPFELIRVYLTFPMGARALEVEDGAVLFVGCVLYLVTGALYGIAFHLVATLWLKDASRTKRLLVFTGLGIGLWVFNFYLVLSWLQPVLQGGDWIVRMVPFWVGALTHLTFAWTVLAGEFWGRFESNLVPESGG